MRDFKMTMVDSHSRPIIHQSSEGLSITKSIKDRERGKKTIIMNSKKEF